MSHSLHIFAGPSLRPADRELLPNARFHPPVVQGDVYRLVARRPLAIGIIDGYFERVPTVWHKEILWALQSGVHVFGSASMGALRAAELAPFGMVGVGTIFEDYVSGVLEDDDEVTLVHADAAHGYRKGSEPLVNMRATLRSAVQQKVIGEDSCTTLLAHLKSLYYPERSYEGMMTWAQNEGLEQGLELKEMTPLERWLAKEGNREDVKGDDARAMLLAMKQFCATSPGPKQVSFTFQHTDAWAQVKRSIPDQGYSGCENDDPGYSHVMDTLHQMPDHETVTAAAQIRHLRLLLSAEQGHIPSDEQIEQCVFEFRRQRRLTNGASVRKWMNEQQLDEAGFERLMADEARVQRIESLTRGDLNSVVLDVLRLNGRLGTQISAGIQNKQKQMHDIGRKMPNRK